jgi:acetylornithine deacetylase/succinyl-diaminopimelate desuccinylase-like protein
MSTLDLHDLAGRVSALSEAMARRQNRFLADLIRIRSYTGQEKPAVERTLAELRTIGCDDVWVDSAGNALGRIGHGLRVILYDAHLDTNEIADEREWPHPPLEPVVEGDKIAEA